MTNFFDADSSLLQEAFDNSFQRENIEEHCTKHSLIRLHEAFLASEHERMDIFQLRNAFEEILEIKIPDDQYSVLFRKIDVRRDGNVTWDEFISYLLLEFQEKDTALESEILQLPITGKPQILTSNHRTPICRIIFCPEVLPDRSTDYQRGCYLTISRDGIINYWSLDFEYERSVQSTSPYLRVQPTAITDMIVMPDIQIVCTSSTERELRFYDTVANKFDLRILVTGLESAVVHMSYYFNVNIKEDSYIILGDTNGSVEIVSFSPVDRGPFKHDPEHELQIFRYEAVLKGELKGMKAIEKKNVHTDWVSQVAYYGSLRGFMSSSRCSECSLLFSDPTGSRIEYKFRVRMGITCFTFCEESQTLATGGPDCIVRLWNPFVTKRANGIFQGHHAAICALIVENSANRIYSLSKDRCIKVWDVLAQSCIQTYNGLSSELGSEYTSTTITYNTLDHKMIIASTTIAIIICDPVINKKSTDGVTHTKPVSCLLYNHLFKVIVSTGLDSCIIVWDPWQGHRLYLVRCAHNQLLYGEHIAVEITAASFDDSDQLLVTGARNGTLKIWNFNTGTCLRNMAIDDQFEITSIVWVENRILCSGSNRRVIEFATSETNVYKKNWGLRHTDDILCSAVRYPQVLATATYNGEIILWRLETGQPYRKYQVNNATARYSITYKQKNRQQEFDYDPSKGNETFLNGQLSRNRATSTHQESALNIVRTVAVRAMIFLTRRPVEPNVGTLLVSLDSGLVQVWSHHPAGGFLKAFSVIHAIGDCALSLATDPDNEFLITGHRIGYIKVWFLRNYLLPNPPKLSLPLLRIEFPFLCKDKILGRAKRAVKDQPLPLLLSSFRGHREAVTSIQILPDARIIVSASTDRTARLWTFGGRYISTLGTFRPWITILPTIPAHRYFRDYRIPPDLKRFSSFTTIKVLEGGVRIYSPDTDLPDLGSFQNQHNLLDGKRFAISALNHSFEMSSTVFKNRPVFDSSLPYIPLYTHLTIHPFEAIKIPKLPSLLHGQKKMITKKVHHQKSWKPFIVNRKGSQN